MGITTSLIVGILGYAIGEAIVRATSSQDSWRNSIFYTFAQKAVLKKNSDASAISEEEVSNSFFGPRQTTESKVPLVFLTSIFKDTHGIGRLIQMIAIVGVFYAMIVSIFGPLKSLSISIAFYFLLNSLGYVVYRFVVLRTESKWVRIFVITATVALLGWASIKLSGVSSRAVKRMPVHVELERYYHVSDSLSEVNERIRLSNDSLRIVQQGIVDRIDSLSRIQIQNKEDFDAAVDFLENFIRSE